jgi:sugar-specific transcriptional regulator TrmB
MKVPDSLLNLGFSQYEITAYLSLIGHHPVNGSQLSRRSGIPRARIYDILTALRNKGFVVELGDGLYAPLPPEELLKRLRHNFESDIGDLEEFIANATSPPSYEYVWTISGYDAVMSKAREMILSAKVEIYVRLFGAEGRRLDKALHKAEGRGVSVKYVSMGPPTSEFKHQVVHPESDVVEDYIGGRTFDIVVDREEILVGMFEAGAEDRALINWAKNHWFVVATRDSLRHDFFHYFLHKIQDQKQRLTAKEKALYEYISRDY